MPALRLIVESSIQEARNLIEPDFSMRSSLNMPLQMASGNASGSVLNQPIFQHGLDFIPMIPHVPSHQLGSAQRVSNLIGGDFEDIGQMEEQKSLSYQIQQPSTTSSHSIAIGGDEGNVHNVVNVEAGTDAVDQ